MAIAVTQNSLAKHIAKRRWVRRLKWFSLPQRASVGEDEHKFYVDLGDWRGPSYHVLNWGLKSYEPKNLEFLSQCLELTPKGVFFDVGANIGIFPYQLSLEFPDLTIHAFEPDLAAFSCLQETFAQPCFTNVHVHRLALSDKKGEAVFYADADNHGGNSLNAMAISDEGNQVSHKISIQTDTLDGFIRSNAIPRLDLIKLDVQRHESEVLLGSHATIAASRPIVLMECYFIELLATTSALLAPFLKNDYVIVDPLTRRQFLMTAEALDSLKKLGGEYCDLAFVPREKSARLTLQ